MVLRQKMHEILQKARVDKVELPVLVDSGEVDDDMDADDEDAPDGSQASETVKRSTYFDKYVPTYVGSKIIGLHRKLNPVPHTQILDQNLGMSM